MRLIYEGLASQKCLQNRKQAKSSTMALTV
jgi:hypothetical protein